MSENSSTSPSNITSCGTERTWETIATIKMCRAQLESPRERNLAKRANNWREQAVSLVVQLLAKFDQRLAAGLVALDAAARSARIVAAFGRAGLCAHTLAAEPAAHKFGKDARREGIVRARSRQHPPVHGAVAKEPAAAVHVVLRAALLVPLLALL